MIVLGLTIMIIGIVIAICFDDNQEFKKVGITLLITFAISVPLIVIGIKFSVKDTKSNHSDEINRTIIITAEDGRVIYEYEKATDIEINSTRRKIKFKDENGERQTIIFGIQDTAQIIGQ